MCKKVKFATEELAIDYIERLKKTSKRRIIPERSYLCEECNSWHLTSIADSVISKQEHQEIVTKLTNNIENLNKQINNLTDTLNKKLTCIEYHKNEIRNKDHSLKQKDERISKLEKIIEFTSNY